MKPAHELRPAQLLDLHPPALGAIVHGKVLERDHAMREALQLEIPFRPGTVVEDEHRAITPNEELFEGQNLPAKTQRIAREHPHLGQGVEHDP